MAQFRTTADYVDAVLNRAGEVTSGNSPYEADALTYLNKVHHALVSGGLVLNTEVDEDWTWARARNPYVIELSPKYDTGTVTLTNGSAAGTFSAGPTLSYAGWYLREDGKKTLYKVIAHTAGATAFEIDANYVGTTGSGKSYELYKLDYELIPQQLYIEAGKNDIIDFIYTGSTEVAVTLTAGTYTPAELATHVESVLDAYSGPASDFGCTYSATTRKFTLTSDRQSSEVFKLLNGTGDNVDRSALKTLGFDYVDTSDAGSHVGTYPLGGVSRLIAPIRCYRTGTYSHDVQLLDRNTFNRDYPLRELRTGIPRKACILREEADGLLTLRFDRYPSEAVKIEVELIEVPKDLKDNVGSVPLVPRKFADILEFGAAYYLLLDKEDTKAADYLSLAREQLKLMQKLHRAELRRADNKFAQVSPRPDKTAVRRLSYGYDVGDD